MLIVEKVGMANQANSGTLYLGTMSTPGDVTTLTFDMVNTFTMPSGYHAIWIDDTHTFCYLVNNSVTPEIRKYTIG